MVIVTSLFLVTYLFLESILGEPRVNPTVNTSVGRIRGLQASDGNYTMFLGIPYAKIDEKNPFGKSKPYPHFDEEFNANDDTAVCPQISIVTFLPQGTLDCLNLNIYVPNSASSENLLPVLFWINGGNFQIGIAGRTLYGPKYIVRHDVILITVSYRLGPYGFMCLDTPEVPGNQGLKDQLAALRWVKDNIEAFGGDANKITLGGQSAGGRCVDLHLLSPQKKLFKNVLMQSGTALVRNTFVESNTTALMKLVKNLGLTTTSITDALSFLSGVDPKLVIVASLKIGYFFKPCVEKTFDNVEKFISDHPINIRDLKLDNIRILLGNTNNEQVARYASKTPEFFNDVNVFYDLLKENFDCKVDQLIEMERMVRSFYLGEMKISQESMWELINFDSDFTYDHPTERSMNMYVNNGVEKIFYYIFSYNGERNYFKRVLYNVTIGGASHADDLGYLFDIAMYQNPAPEDQLIIDRITTLWTNFVKFRDPTPKTSDLLPVKWEPIDKDAMFYLNIDSELSFRKWPFHERMAFWDLFYNYNWKFQKFFRSHV